MEPEQLKYLTNLPEPPYYVVVFSSRLNSVDEAYEIAAQRMLELAAEQDGFLGVDSVRKNQMGITVSYWRDEASILNWKQQQEHRQAQNMGRSQWYDEYSIQIAKVERNYNFKRDF